MGIYLSCLYLNLQVGLNLILQIRFIHESTDGFIFKSTGQVYTDKHKCIAKHWPGSYLSQQVGFILEVIDKCCWYIIEQVTIG